MAQSPIIVKDSTHIVKNPRQEFFDEEIDKIRGGKGIVLKGFKTEKVRIEEHLRNINFYYPKTDDKNKDKDNNFNNDKNKIIPIGNTMKQPEMRFKPRTDLERIFDEINKNSYRKIDKNIIEKQFKTIEMNSIRKFNNENEHSINQGKDEIFDYKEAGKNENNFKDELDHLENDKEKTEKKKAEIDKKNKLLNKIQKKELNSQAKNLMKEFHNKTHFKGVSSMFNFKNRTCIIFLVYYFFNFQTFNKKN